MKCAYCKDLEANKRNTHYLTDKIIRSNLNEDGGNERERGSYWDISSDEPFPIYNFQRGTSLKTLKEVLGHEPSEEEIEAAKKVPFSVDYVFCDICEKEFGKIEEAFISKYLGCFREKDLSKIKTLHCKNSKPFRMFFLLQIWRTMVCLPKMVASAEVIESLRKDLRSSDESKLKMWRLSLTYLQTLTESNTSNVLAIPLDSPYQLIMMNDFIVQFFDSDDKVIFQSLHGINDEADFKYYININEDVFRLKVISDEKRKEILKGFAEEFQAQKISHYTRKFVVSWIERHRQLPSKELVREFQSELVQWEGLPVQQRQSRDRIERFTMDFINKHSI